MKAIKNGIVAGLIASAGFIGLEAGSEDSPVEKIMGSDETRFITYKEGALFDSPNFKNYQAMSFLPGKWSKKGKLEGLNAYYFESSMSDAQAQIRPGWKVIEDKVYTIDMGCKPVYEPLPPDDHDHDEEVSPELGNGEEVPWGVKRVKGIQAMKVTAADEIIVCIADTGIDKNHSELRSRIVGGKSFVSGVTSWQDDQGHGTHLGGTIGAAFDAEGIVGVSQARMLIAKVLDRDGSGMGSWIAAGIKWCVDQDAKVINLSLGAPRSAGPDPLIKEAILYAARNDVRVAMAAGNDGGRVGWPAALAPNHDNLYAVAASDSRNRLASFSSRGPEISVIAPGVGVKSSRLGGGFVTWDGTSMATPHVAASIALALSAGKTEIEFDDIGLPDEHQGKGLVNALKSVQ